MAKHIDSDECELLAHRAAILERAGRTDEAIAMWLTACAAGPRRADLALRTGLLLLRASRQRDAAPLLRRAVDLEPTSTKALQALAVALIRDAQFAEAARCFDRLTELEPNRVEHLVHMAEALERLRDLPAARAAIARALEIDPRSASALAILAQHTLRDGDPRAAIEIAERAIAGATKPRVIARSHHLIGRALDMLGDHAGTFAAHMRANAVNLELLNGPAALTSPIEWRMRSPGRTGLAARFAAWAATAPTNTPDPIFLCGFPRSGTTLMEQIVGMLPDLMTNDEQGHSAVVFQAMERDDPGCLTRDLAATLDAMPADRIARYRAMFWNEIIHRIPGWREGVGMIAVDKQPLRLMDAVLIQRLFPRARMIVMIRDPRDVCLSALFQDFDLNPYMARFLDVEAAGGFHAEVMEFWLEMRQIITMPWIEVQYRNLVRTFEAETARVAEFLDVSWSGSVHEFDRAAQSRAVSSASFLSVTRKLDESSIGRWRDYREHLDPILKVVRPIVDAFGYDQD